MKKHLSLFVIMLISVGSLMAQNTKQPTPKTVKRAEPTPAELQMRRAQFAAEQQAAQAAEAARLAEAQKVSEEEQKQAALRRDKPQTDDWRKALEAKEAAERQAAQNNSGLISVEVPAAEVNRPAPVSAGGKLRSSLSIADLEAALARTEAEIAAQPAGQTDAKLANKAAHLRKVIATEKELGAK